MSKIKACWEDCKCHWKYIVGTVAAIVVAKKVFNSPTVRKSAVNCMASTMKMQQDALYKLEVMKEDAQDVLADQVAAEAVAEDKAE